MDVNIAPFGGVAKEWGVAQRRVRLPMPLFGVPWEILDESRFKNPVKGGVFYLESAGPWQLCRLR